MQYTAITSPSNPHIKEAIEIKNKRSSKHRHAAFIIEGPHLIEIALASGHQIKQVFFTSAFSSKKEGQKLLRQISKRADVIPAKAGIQKPSFQELKTTSELDSHLRGNDGLELFEVSEHILSKFADTETPQGIIAVASYSQKNLEDIKFKSVPLIAIIDGIQEPGNLGTIIRTSDAAGADAVIILKDTCDPFMPKALRATAGSIFNIPVLQAETDLLLRWLKGKRIKIAITSVYGGNNLFDADLKNSLAFVFGNESQGVSSLMTENAEIVLKIPILGKAESLNVSASAAVCLYEAVRQRFYFA
ncbi:MAG: RNA methyltransferase [Nitrospirae bacterium]|nr:RNA methyltransferase [Nitrospirota bacterium]